jgi:hypothetical protein
MRIEQQTEERKTGEIENELQVPPLRALGAAVGMTVLLIK